MSSRILLTSLAWALCLGTVWGVFHQRQEVLALRAQQLELARTAAASSQIPSPAANNPETLQSSDSSVESELLQLRAEVTRLNARKRELSGVAEEAERLRAQLERNQTNSAAGTQLPAGYMRKSQAQFVGYSTPENTLQSLIWAMQHHDMTRFLETLSPEEAQGMRARLDPSGQPEKGFFKAMDSLPGMAIQSRQDFPDGSVELQVEIGPGMPPEKMRLRPMNGEWKIESLF